MLWGIGRPVLVFVVACLSIIALGVIGHLTPHARIVRVLELAGEVNAFNQAGDLQNDMFTECMLLESTLNRDENLLRDLAGTNYRLPWKHTCEVMLDELHDPAFGDPPVARITRYHYGSRHIFAALSSVMTLGAMRTLVLALSVIGPLLIWAGFFRHRSRYALDIAPVIFVLLLGFALNHLGRNIGHAPGYAFPLMGLGAVVWFRNYFAPLSRRMAAYVAIAAAAAYFDILSGPLPFMLGLMIVINHFCYDLGGAGGDGHAVWTRARAKDWKGAFRAFRTDYDWLWQPALLSAVFVITCLSLLAFRLIFAGFVFHFNPVSEFMPALSQRMSSQVNGVAYSWADEFGYLWMNREIPLFGSKPAATMFYGAGLIGWISALVLVAWRARAAWRHLVVLAGASSVILLWYLVFVNHSVVHIAFMTRIGGLAPACGLIAISVIGGMWGRIYSYAALATSVALVLLFSLFGGVSVVAAAATDRQDIDVAACSNERRLFSDGVPDRVISVDFLGPRIGFAEITSFVLYRDVPPSQWNSRLISYPVTVLSADGRHLSDSRANLNARLHGRKRLLFAFCEDGYSMPDAKFMLQIQTTGGAVATQQVQFGE